MKDYSNYSSVELAADEDFAKWVKTPSQFPENDHFWREWVKSHPEKKEIILESRSLILAVLSEIETENVDVKQQAVWAKLEKSISNIQKSAEIKASPYRIYKLAAVLLFLLTVSAAIWLTMDNSVPTSATVAESTFIKEINNGTKPKTIVLGDGTSILLQPKSYIQYPEAFTENIREIHLVGEAFFDVAKDPSKPFIVYSDQLVTKVTGTSFTIRAFKDEDNFVQVKTGKVSVFMKAESKRQNKGQNSQRDGVFLSPNQQVVFDREESRLVKSLVENPTLLNTSLKQRFEFKDTPLRQVFSILQKSYGIEIVFDEETLGDCSLNASLDELPLYDKMRLICKGVNAKYEILDSRIIVSGKGCK